MNYFQNKSFLKEVDFSGKELQYLIDFAAHLKWMKQNHIPHAYLQGKNIALLFEKKSTRTRSSFTVAAVDLGAHPEFLGKDDIHLGKKESVSDTAKVLGRMYDGIEFRGFAQDTVETLATYSGVPVWNGLTDQWHPTQMIADFLTLKENFGYLRGLTLTYLGDAHNNVANSLLITAAKLSVNIKFGAPKSLWPDEQIVQRAQKIATENNSQILITEDVLEAVVDADAIYTDVWISMGDQVDPAQRIKQLLPYQINQSLIEQTGKKNTIVMHCLPAYHDHGTVVGKQLGEQFDMDALEITDGVFNGEHSVVFDEAENRLHAIKAIMAATLGDLFIPNALFE